MASAAEQMAQNMNWGAFGKAKDLQRRLLFAVGIFNSLPSRDLYTSSWYRCHSIKELF